VEINEEKVESEKPKQAYNLYEGDNQFDFGMGTTAGEGEKRATNQTNQWGFENKQGNVEIQQENNNNFDDGFDDFEQAQEAKPEEHQENKQDNNDGFDDFQFEAAPQQKQNKNDNNKWDDIQWDEPKQGTNNNDNTTNNNANNTGGFDFGGFQEQPQKEVTKDEEFSGFEFGNANANNNNAGNNQNTFFDMEFDKGNQGKEQEKSAQIENKEDVWANFDQGFEGFQKTETENKEVKWDEGKEEKENQGEDEGFDDFEEYNDAKKIDNEHNHMDSWGQEEFQEAKKEEDVNEKQEEKVEIEDEGFGDFEGGKEEEKETKIENNNEEAREENAPIEKKVTIYDIDFTGKKNQSIFKLNYSLEFGIEDKTDQTLPPLELNLGFNTNKEANSAQVKTAGLGIFFLIK